MTKLLSIHCVLITVKETGRHIYAVKFRLSVKNGLKHFKKLREIKDVKKDFIMKVGRIAFTLKKNKYHHHNN